MIFNRALTAAEIRQVQDAIQSCSSLYMRLLDGPEGYLRLHTKVLK